ncbi:MAG: aldolase/citrate lyase family protein, partial [Candidatus Latescibacterota bacterium]|nr:aldolase/citrate lyase family protein [Candidatus Latescibacterota bacterium]
MRTNPVKQTLAQGGTAVGTMAFEFCTPGLARLAANAGADFIIYDMEHTGWSIETVRNLIASGDGAPIVPFVRVPATQYHFIARVLDVGAMGIMVPMVGDAAQAEMIVQSAKYPPLGQRGAAFHMAHDGYAGGDVLEKMRSANDEVVLIAQIENRSGLENVERIAAVDGIDILWIGQFDLSNFLGIPGQFTHPTFLDAIKRVTEACQRY